MPIKLSKVFRPQSIAVIGASIKENSVGRTVLENVKRAEFPGQIYPVNPRYESLLDLKAYPSVSDLPAAPDLAIIATPAPTVPAIVGECGKKGIFGLIVLSAGFREVGEAGKVLESELAAVIAKFPDMRVIGPNCLGVMVPDSCLNANAGAIIV
jgi:acetyltransferase